MPNECPFLIIKDFLSPLDCENIISGFNNHFPNYNKNGKDLKTTLSNPLYEKRIWNKLEGYFEFIEQYYTVEINSLTALDVEWFPEKCEQEKLRCENSMFFSKKWKIVNDQDFTIIIFLKDSNTSKDFDSDFECYGGKLEFPNHQFGFDPQRGTAIIFPSNQYFLNITKSPLFGDLFQIRMHIVCENRFKYDPKNYSGNYKTWF